MKPATFTRDGERIVIRPGSGLPLEADWHVDVGSWFCVLDGIRYTVTVTALPIDESLPMAVVKLEAKNVGAREGSVVIVAEWRERVDYADPLDRLEQAYSSICAYHRWVDLVLLTSTGKRTGMPDGTSG